MGWRAGVPLAALVAGLLFATSANTSHGVDLRVAGRDDVNSLAARQQRAVITQTKQLADLQKKVQAATSLAAKTDSRVASARASAQGVADAVGLEPVSGPTLTVTLNDAPALPGSQKGSVPPDYLVVHQQDVQGVVNALWAGGAEAMTVAGQRIIATSAVRCVGNTLLLNGEVFSPPFRVAAIGPYRTMQGALNASPGVKLFQQAAGYYGLGYTTASESQLRLAAYTGSIALAYAHAGTK
jgi:uncharacterized protein YlxW (UPF0749 family)